MHRDPIHHLSDAIEPLIDPIHGPDGSTVPTLSVSATAHLAAQHGIAGRQVEIAALEKGVIPARYLRNRSSLDTAAQVRLLNARAAIIGLGGLGGLVVEILARIGVGQLVLIDGDRFEDHNLNRQQLSTQNNLGVAKSAAAEQRVAAVNPSIETTVHADFVTPANAGEWIEGCQVVIDCLDSITTRFEVEKVCKQKAIPLISAAVAGVTGHVTTIFPGDRGLELIYGPYIAIRHPQGAEIGLGCLPQAVSLVAAMESAEALKILSSRKPHLLRNKLWVMDLTDNTFEILSLVPE